MLNNRYKSNKNNHNQIKMKLKIINSSCYRNFIFLAPVFSLAPPNPSSQSPHSLHRWRNWAWIFKHLFIHPAFNNLSLGRHSHLVRGLCSSWPPGEHCCEGFGAGWGEGGVKVAVGMYPLAANAWRRKNKQNSINQTINQFNCNFYTVRLRFPLIVKQFGWIIILSIKLKSLPQTRIY